MIYHAEIEDTKLDNVMDNGYNDLALKIVSPMIFTFPKLLPEKTQTTLLHQRLSLKTFLNKPIQ